MSAPPCLEPVESDDAHQPEAPMHQFLIDDRNISKDTWLIVVRELELLVQNADGSKQFLVPLMDHFRYLDLIDSGTRQVLVLRQAGKAVIGIDPNVHDALDAWRGPSNEAWLRFDLRGVIIKFIIGVLFLAPSLIDLNYYFSDGRPFDLRSWEGLVLGVVMLVIVAISQFKPHRFAILLDVGWWICLLAFRAIEAIDNVTVWALFWIVFPLFFAYLRYRIYWKHACRTPDGHGVGGA